MGDKREDDRQLTKEDSAELKDKVGRLLDLAFPGKKDELKPVKEAPIFVLEPGTPEYDAFREKKPEWLGANWPGPNGERLRAVLTEIDGIPIPMGFAAMVAAHEAGHDLQKDHEADGGLMSHGTPPPMENTYEEAVRQALVTGGRALDKEHMERETKPGMVGEARQWLKEMIGLDPADSKPSKAVMFDMMTEANKKP